jgi:hypothetical protein
VLEAAQDHCKFPTSLTKTIKMKDVFAMAATGGALLTDIFLCRNNMLLKRLESHRSNLMHILTAIFGLTIHATLDF